MYVYIRIMCIWFGILVPIAYRTMAYFRINTNAHISTDLMIVSSLQVFFMC